MLRRNIVTRVTGRRLRFIIALAVMFAFAMSSPARADDGSAWLPLRRAAVAPPGITDQVGLTAGLALAGGRVSGRFASRSALGLSLQIRVAEKWAAQVGFTGYETSRATATAAGFAEPRLALVYRPVERFVVAAGLDGVLADRSWPGRPLGWIGLRVGSRRLQAVAVGELADAARGDSTVQRAAELRGRWQYGAALHWSDGKTLGAALGWRGASDATSTGPQLALFEVSRRLAPSPGRATLVPWLRIEQPLTGTPRSETLIGIGLRAIVRLTRSTSGDDGEAPPPFDPFGS